LLTDLLGISQTARAGYFKDCQQQQGLRIQQGIASGQLTPRETENLYRDQRQLRQLKRHYLADGALSGRENRILKERLEQSSNRIYQYKHNRQRVEPPRYHGSGFRFFALR
jgi:hypothetical protein